MNATNQEKRAQSREAINTFHNKYGYLDAGDKAQLRREDSPDLTSAFWYCFNPARNIDSHLSIKRCRQLLRFFPLLTQQDMSVTNGKEIGIGEWLRNNKKEISLRRVETLFTLGDIDELIDELLAMAAIDRRGDKEIDYHTLYWELWKFEQGGEKRLEVQRAWARAYFQDI